MLPHTRQLAAAAAYALLTGRKVAGLFDHGANRHLRIAAEARGPHLQGYDAERGVRFGGTLPEILDAGDNAYLSMAVEDGQVRGYDRRSARFFTVVVEGPAVQLFDHGEERWHAFAVQSA